MATCGADVTWLRVVGLESPGVEASLNALLVPDSPPSDPGGSCDDAAHEEQSAEVTYNAHDVLSVRYATAMDAGGAHPMYGRHDFVMDVSTGDALDLEACLTPQGVTRIRARLTDIVQEQSDNRRAYLTEALAVTPLAFLVRPEGIEIDVFNQTPHYDKGAAENLFDFGWKELRPLLTVDCKLSRVAAGG